MVVRSHEHWLYERSHVQPCTRGQLDQFIDQLGTPKIAITAKMFHLLFISDMFHVFDTHTENRIKAGKCQRQNK
jgi:hypothetical protein